MTTFTHAGSAVIASQTSAAASTYASPSAGCQSADQDLTAAGGAIWTLRFVNGGTGPTLVCQAQVDISYDGSTWRQWGGTISGPSLSSATQDTPVELPPPVMHTRVTFFGNTDQAVTVSAEIQKLTGLA